MRRAVRTIILIGFILFALWDVSHHVNLVAREPIDEVKWLFSHQTDEVYLKKTFHEFNEQYFGSKLTEPEFRLVDGSIKEMALTERMKSDKHFVVTFNLKYTAAPRVADFTLIHEMCHIRTWEEVGADLEHGPKWRACMLSADSMGAFREIIIDGYQEKTAVF